MTGPPLPAVDDRIIMPESGYEVIDGEIFWASETPEPTDLPAVDDRLIVPESGFEAVDGELYPVSPAHEPHGSRHAKLSSLLEAYAAEGFNTAVDMLTRTGRRADFAPDVSLYPVARDPQTGGRQLEHLAFEVVSTQTMAHAGAKARAMLARGVRRVFAIDVGKERGLEWSSTAKAWVELDPEDRIEDEALALPLSVRELVTCARTDDAVAEALLAKHNAVLTAALDEREQHGRRLGRRQGRRQGRKDGLEKGLEQGLEQGLEKGLRQGLLSVLTARGLPLSDAQREVIEATTDLAVLERWVAAAVTCTQVTELLAEGPA